MTEYECKCTGDQMELVGHPCVGCLLNQRNALLAACKKARYELALLYDAGVSGGSDISDAIDLLDDALAELE